MSRRRSGGTVSRRLSNESESAYHVRIAQETEQVVAQEEQLQNSGEDFEELECPRRGEFRILRR